VTAPEVSSASCAPCPVVVAVAGAIAEASGFCRIEDLLEFAKKEPRLVQGVLALAHEYVEIVKASLRLNLKADELTAGDLGIVFHRWLEGKEPFER
jgi:hypothetical protein